MDRSKGALFSRKRSNPWLVFIIGLILLLLGLANFYATRNFIKVARRANGKVVGLELHESRSRRGSSRMSYYPVVEFAINGAEKVFESKSGSNPAAYSVGDGVEVLYDPVNISDARINSFSSLWFAGTIFVSAGLFFSLVGVYGIQVRQRRLREQSAPSQFTNSPSHNQRAA
jgi:hypothetical protein